MRIDHLHNSLDLGESDVEVIQGGIDPKSWSIIFNNLLTYSRPIESLVREITSNCFDSHREAESIKSGVSDETLEEMGYLPEEYDMVRSHFREWEETPITIEMESENRLTGTQEAIVFRDNGVGLSPHRVRSIYAMLAASTKRGSNNQLGAFGIGSKAPLGYTDSFYVVTRYFGRKYYYVVRKGHGLELDVFGDEPTDEPNGTEIIVGIKNGDWTKFQSAVQEQLAYFPEINFVNCGVTEGIVYRGENFLFRSPTPFQSKLHLAIEGVYYPLDFDAMGFTSYDFYYKRKFWCPLALRFSLDELGFAIMEKRENIRYTDDVRAVINKKIDDAIAELEEIHKDNFSDISTFSEYYERTGTETSSLVLMPGVELPDATRMLEVRPRYPKYEGLKIPTAPFVNWQIHRHVVNGNSQYIAKRDRDRSVSSLINGTTSEIYVAPANNMSSAVSDYICWKQNRPSFYTIEHKEISDKQLVAIFECADDEQIALAREFLKETDEYIRSNFAHYDDFKPESDAAYQTYLASKPKDVFQKRVRADDEFNVSMVYLDHHEYYYDTCAKYSRNNVKARTLEGFTGIFLYGHQEDSDLLLKVAPVLFTNPAFFRYESDRYLNRKRAIIGKIAMASVKFIKHLPGAIHVKDFVKSNHRTIRRFNTAMRLHEDTTPILDSVRLKWKIIPEDVRNDFLAISRYRNHIESNFWRRNEKHLAICRDLLECDEVNEEVFRKLGRISAYCEKYPILEYLERDPIAFMDEFQFYLRGKGPVDPQLLRRLARYKEQKEEQKSLNMHSQEDADYSGDGHASSSGWINVVDTYALNN